MKFGFENISKSYSGLELFRNFNLQFNTGRISCILGPSGCGKTTLLNILSSNIEPDSGKIFGLDHPRIAFVFQEPRLLPWKTVRKNLEFILPANQQLQAHQELVNHFLSMVGLAGFQDYYPSQLSGGMKQRVALARAFIYPSDLILMDEPFRGLDLKLKKELMDSLHTLWAEEKRTVIFVTHDLEEAALLGEEIFIFSSPPVKLLSHIDKGELNNQTDSLKMIYLDKFPG